MSIIKYTWRITKYNPNFRNRCGDYSNNEWTSFSDLYKSVTFREYLAVESMYVNVISKFMEYLSLSHLKVEDLEKNDISFLDNPEIYYNRFPYIQRKEYIYEIVESINEGMKLSNNKVRSVSRLILRDIIWCKLVSDTKLFVHFGFDYYMYIGSNENCTPVINWIEEKTQLFVEDYKSPYLEDEFGQNDINKN